MGKVLIVLIFSLAVLVPCSAEMLDSPPIDLEMIYTSQFSLFPGAAGWIDFHQYNRNEEDLTFGKDFQLAILIPIISSGRFTLSGMTQEIVQGCHLTEAEKLWLFSPRLIISDLRFFASVNLYPMEIHCGFHHDCAHAIDKYPLRNSIHEGLFLQGMSRKLPIPWGHSGFASTLRGSAEIEVSVLSFIQTQGYEPDRFRFSLWGRSELIAHPLYGSMFVSGKFSFIRRETEETPVLNSVNPGLDWFFRTGYRTPGRAGGITLYYQIEKITDPWEDNAPQPVLLQAVGIVLSIDNFSSFSYHAQHNEN